MIAALGLVAAVVLADNARASPTEVGTVICAACHYEKQHDAWRGSHYERTVLGDFGGARSTHAGVTTGSFRRDGRF